MTMKPNTKYEPTTEGDRAITKEMNVWTYTQRKNYENDGNKEKRERNKSEMRNCARIIYGNMLYLNDHFCWKKPFFLILFVSVCLFWLVKCIWGQQNEKKNIMTAKYIVIVMPIPRATLIFPHSRNNFGVDILAF